MDNSTTVFGMLPGGPDCPFLLPAAGFGFPCERMLIISSWRMMGHNLSHPFKLLSLTPTFDGRVKRAATLHRGEKSEKAIYFLVA